MDIENFYLNDDSKKVKKEESEKSEKRETSKKKEQPITRRKALKRLAGAAVGVGLGLSGIGIFTAEEKRKKRAEDRDLQKKSVGKKEESENMENNEVLEAEGGTADITEEERGEREEIVVQEEGLEKQDKIYGSIEEVCKLKVDEKTSFKKKDLMRYYERYYSGAGKKNLVKGFLRMEKIVDIEKLKSIFVKEGVPEELIYVSMTETYWNPKKIVSNKQAVGFWQFLKKTGKQYGLTINSKKDERKDPLLAGRACARYLRDLYEEYDNDWDLALNKYNSGYPHKYKKHARGKKEAMSYDNFLSYMEKRFDMNKKIIASGGYYLNHKVKKRDNFNKITAKYKISLDELLKVNPSLKKRSIIYPGQKLDLPVKKHVMDLVSEEKFKEWAYKEAIGYTPNVLAVIKLSKDKNFLASVAKESKQKRV